MTKPSVLPNYDALYSRIAAALGWTVEQVQSFDRPSLRELVRVSHPKLAAEITETLRSDSVIIGEGLEARKRAAFDAAFAAVLGSRCPACGRAVSQNADYCPHCNRSFND